MKSLQEIRQTVFDQAKVFKEAIERKDYGMAKVVYEDTRNTSVLIGMSGADLATLFGTEEQQGLFRIDDVQKAYYEVAVKSPSYDQAEKILAYKLEKYKLKFAE